MKKKFFVTSDVHSHFTPFKKALDEKGFDPNNENHWLVVCGDLYDRGSESIEVFKYVMSLERKILVRGNHELLLEELCMRGFPYGHDKSNGTVRTVEDISGIYSPREFQEACNITYNKLARYRELLVNYFETQNYIFVHSWIPTNVHYDGKMKPWYQEGKTLTYMEDWRNANDVEWEEAMWGNPFKRWQEGLNKTGKIIVFGHWHCSTGHALLTEFKNDYNETEYRISEFEDDAIWEPWHHNNCIAIDRCVAYTNELNVVIIEDEFDENWLKKYGDKI